MAHRRSCSSSSGGNLLNALRQLDTASLCDADKQLRRQRHTESSHRGLQLLDPSKIRPINDGAASQTTAGYAFTVQCTVKNDLLAVLRGLVESSHLVLGEDSTSRKDPELVLVVDTLNSVRAVAGELFATQALAQGNLAGLLIDGPVRDTAQLQSISLPVFATGSCPDAGTIQHPGQTGCPVEVAGVTVNPGDVVVADRDGIVTADCDTMERLLPLAREITDAEAAVKEQLESGTSSLEDLTNYREHLAARLRRQASQLEFRL